MKQPIASPVHPQALERCLPEEKIRVLQDAFFRNNPPSSELYELVAEAVPGADRHVTAREDFRREMRSALHNERAATAGGGKTRGNANNRRNPRSAESND